jgi:hypothetical protein
MVHEPLCTMVAYFFPPIIMSTFHIIMSTCQIIIIMTKDWLIDWLFIVLRPAQEYFTYMETSLLPVKGCKFRPMLGAQGHWAGRDLYRATPAVTRDLGFSGLIRRTAPFSRLLRHTRGCGGSILTRILTGFMTKDSVSCHLRLLKSLVSTVIVMYELLCPLVR